jgi:hypothetical protein
MYNPQEMLCFFGQNKFPYRLLFVVINYLDMQKDQRRRENEGGSEQSSSFRWLPFSRFPFLPVHISSSSLSLLALALQHLTAIHTLSLLKNKYVV